MALVRWAFGYGLNCIEAIKLPPVCGLHTSPTDYLTVAVTFCGFTNRQELLAASGKEGCIAGCAILGLGIGSHRIRWPLNWHSCGLSTQLAQKMFNSYVLGFSISYSSPILGIVISNTKHTGMCPGPILWFIIDPVAYIQRGLGSNSTANGLEGSEVSYLPGSCSSARVRF